MTIFYPKQCLCDKIKPFVLLRMIRTDAVKVMISITTPFPMNFVHWSYAIHKVLYRGNP